MTSSVTASGPRAFLASLRITILTFLADPQWIIGSAAAPVVFALASFEIFRSTPSLVLFAILGGGMMSMWAQTLYGSGWAIGQDRFIGTLEPTLGAPVDYIWVVAGRVVWNTVSGLLGGALVFAVVVVAYDQPLPIHDPIAFVLLFVLVMLSLSTIGLLFTAIFVYSRYAGFVQNIGEFTFYVITGCMFPILVLPGWTRPFSLAFPATWALEALRADTFPSYTPLSWGVSWDLVGTGVLSLAYVVISIGLYRHVVHYLSDTGGGSADEY